MKKHKDKNQPVTIGDFQELRGGFKTLTGDVQELRGDFQEFAEFVTNNMVTKEDAKCFATKDDLKAFADKALKTFATKDNISQSEDRLEGRMRKYRDDILTSNDRLAKKLDTVLTEQAAHFGGHDRMDETLREHGSDIKHIKQRVTHLEVKAGIA